MKKLRYLALFILALGLLSAWSAAVRHVHLGGTGLGKLTTVVRQFSEFPSTVKQLFSEPLAGTHLSVDPEMETYDHLDGDLWILGSFYSTEDNNWSIELRNLRNDAVINTWTVSENDLAGKRFLGYDGRTGFSQQIRFDHLRPLSPILSGPQSVTVLMDESDNLLCYDGNGIKWQNNDLIFHHSLEKDASGNLWTCGTAHTGSGYNAAFRNPGGQLVPYRDDAIVEVDAETGITRSVRSISDILIGNGYAGLLAVRLENDFDPVHLNKVEPVYTSGRFWDRGDLFVSLRNLNTVFLYRPSNDSILWLRTGPFLTQHDVDVLDTTRISIFNNNYLTPNKRPQLTPDGYGPVEVFSEETHSQFLIYDFKTDSFSTPLSLHFEEAGILCPTEGLVQTLRNGDVFVEQQNSGELFIINPEKGIRLKKVFTVEGRSGKAHLPNWSRIYEEL